MKAKRREEKEKSQRQQIFLQVKFELNLTKKSTKQTNNKQQQQQKL